METNIYGKKSIQELMDHCRQYVVRKDRSSFEHYIFMCLLKEMSVEQFERLEKEFDYIMED